MSQHEVRNELVVSNLGLVRKIAWEYSRETKIATYDELFQIGAIGLIKACDRFDPSRGHKISTYAFSAIKGEIQHYFRDIGVTPIRIPRKEYKLGHRFRSISLDTCLFDEDDRLADLIPDQRGIRVSEHEIEMATVVSILEQLDEETRLIINLVYLENMIHAEVAQRLGVCKMTVLRRSALGITQLRDMVAKEAI